MTHLFGPPDHLKGGVTALDTIATNAVTPHNLMLSRNGSLEPSPTTILGHISRYNLGGGGGYDKKMTVEAVAKSIQKELGNTFAHLIFPIKTRQALSQGDSTCSSIITQLTSNLAESAKPGINQHLRQIKLHAQLPKPKPQIGSKFPVESLQEDVASLKQPHKLLSSFLKQLNLPNKVQNYLDSTVETTIRNAVPSLNKLLEDGIPLGLHISNESTPLSNELSTETLQEIFHHAKKLSKHIGSILETLTYINHSLTSTLEKYRHRIQENALTIQGNETLIETLYQSIAIQTNFPKYIHQYMEHRFKDINSLKKEEVDSISSSDDSESVEGHKQEINLFKEGLHHAVDKMMATLFRVRVRDSFLEEALDWTKKELLKTNNNYLHKNIEELSAKLADLHEKFVAIKIESFLELIRKTVLSSDRVAQHIATLFGQEHDPLFHPHLEELSHLLLQSTLELSEGAQSLQSQLNDLEKAQKELITNMDQASEKRYQLKVRRTAPTRIGETYAQRAIERAKHNQQLLRNNIGDLLTLPSYKKVVGLA